jgi:hypothetical protein
MPFNTLEEISCQIPNGEWKSITEAVEQIDAENSERIILELLTSVYFEPSKMTSGAIRLPENCGYGWFIDEESSKASFDNVLNGEYVMLTFSIQGGHAQLHPGRGELPHDGVCISLSVSFKVHKQVRLFDADAKYQYFVVGVKLDEFKRRFGSTIGKNNQELNRMLSMYSEQPCWQFYPVKNNMRSVCTDMLNAQQTFPKALRYQYFQAKFLELLHLAVNYISSIEYKPPQQVN